MTNDCDYCGKRLKNYTKHPTCLLYQYVCDGMQFKLCGATCFSRIRKAYGIKNAPYIWKGGLAVV